MNPKSPRVFIYHGNIKVADQFLFHQMVNLRKYAKPAGINVGTQADIDNDIESIYRRVKSKPAYSSKIKDFLQADEANSKHGRIVKKKFPRRRIIVNHPRQIFMADLIEYTRSPKMKYANRNFVYILVMIDCFSKFIWVRPLKKKSGAQVSKAVEEILSGLDELPNTLITDEGKEFYNAPTRKILDQFNIHHYSILTKIKASMVERVNRTLKTKIEKYMTTNKTIKWLDIIDDVAAGYNSTPHRSIGMAPERVTYEDTEKIFKKLYPDIDLVVEPKLKKGNIVRILRKKSLFDKGYKQNWSTDVYKIKSHKQKAGVVWYKLVSLGGKEVSGSHYLYELRKIADDFESYNSKKF